MVLSSYLVMGEAEVRCDEFEKPVNGMEEKRIACFVPYFIRFMSKTRPVPDGRTGFFDKLRMCVAKRAVQKQEIGPPKRIGRSLVNYISQSIAAGSVLISAERKAMFM